MRPCTAAAAHVAGDARKIEALALPMRALKFRLAVETTFMPSLGIGADVPQHGPQPGGVITAPMAASLATVPSRSSSSKTSFDAGDTTSCTLGATPPPASSTRSAS